MAAMSANLKILNNISSQTASWIELKLDGRRRSNMKIQNFFKSFRSDIQDGHPENLQTISAPER